MTQAERERMKAERIARKREQERENAPKVRELEQALADRKIYPESYHLASATIIVKYNDFEEAVKVQNELNNGATVARRI